MWVDAPGGSATPSETPSLYMIMSGPPVIVYRTAQIEPPLMTLLYSTPYHMAGMRQ